MNLFVTSYGLKVFLAGNGVRTITARQSNGTQGTDWVLVVEKPAEPETVKQLVKTFYASKNALLGKIAVRAM